MSGEKDEMVIYAEEYNRQNDYFMGSILTKEPFIISKLRWRWMRPVGSAGEVRQRGHNVVLGGQMGWRGGRRGRI